MLKLERKSKNGQIDLLVRDKDLFLTRPLILAFCLALTLHLLFLVVFQVSLFKIMRSQTLFPEVVVTTDTTHLLDAAETLTDINIESMTLQGIPIPKFSEPKIALYKNLVIDKSMGDTKKIEVLNDFFVDLEKGVYSPELSVMSVNIKKPFEMLISGPLAENNYVLEGGAENIISSLAKMKIPSTQVIVYEVLVDEKSGKIFWFEVKKKSSIAALNRLAENLLRQLIFSKEPIVWTRLGEIEFYFNPVSDNIS